MAKGKRSINAPTVLIAHPYPIVVDALATIAGRAGYTVVRASDRTAAARALARRPDLAIVTPELGGEGAATTLILDSEGSGDGDDGTLPLTAPVERLAERIAAAAGQRPAASRTLTPRERDVAQLVAAGQRNRTIADALGISEGTVKMHLHNVYAKLGLESRTQLALAARGLGAA